MTGIEGLLARTREQIERVTVTEALAELADGALLVDIRPVDQREAEGEIDLGSDDGVLVVARNVLEWRLDPTSGAALPEADLDRRVLVICQQGYASSLAAKTLREIGVHRAADVVGGVDAWREAGLPLRR